MKQLIALIMVGSLSVSPAVAQSQNYTSFSQLTQAAAQASSGQLPMIAGGMMGGGLMASPQNAPAAVPLGTTASQGVFNQPLGAGIASTSTASSSSNSGGTDFTTGAIAAGIGVAALLIPVAVSLFSDDG